MVRSGSTYNVWRSISGHLLTETNPRSLLPRRWVGFTLKWFWSKFLSLHVGLMTTWFVFLKMWSPWLMPFGRNKFCFTGGYIEAAVQLPGTNNIIGMWPAIWTMGNLGRAGYGASLEGLVRVVQFFILTRDCNPIEYSGPTRTTHVMSEQHLIRRSMAFLTLQRSMATTCMMVPCLISLAKNFRDVLVTEKTILVLNILMEPTWDDLPLRLTSSKHKLVEILQVERFLNRRSGL